MPIEELSPGTGAFGTFPVPLRSSIYTLLETVLALSEKVAEMPLCPEQIELVYHVRDAAKELSRLLKGPPTAPGAPIPPADRPPAGETAPVPRGAVAQTVPAPSCRLLLVENSHYRMAEMQRYLAGTPHVMDLAAESGEGLALFHRNRYHAVFLDLRTTGITALQMARLMRVWDEERHGDRTPVIGLVSRRDRTAEEEDEFDDFLSKPVSRSVFLQAIERYGLAAGRAAPPASTPSAAGLLPAFLGRARTGLEKARGAARDADPAEVCAFAEALTAAGGTLGLEVLATLGRKLRAAGRHRDWAKIGRCLDEIDECVAEAPPLAECAGEP